MIKAFKVCLITTVVVSLTGCIGNSSKEDSGTVIGGVLGSVAGNYVAQKTGGIGGAVLGSAIAGMGALIGKELGKYLDEQDKLALQNQVTQQLAVSEPQTSVYCAKTGETRGFTVVAKPPQGQISDAVNSFDCGDKNKIVLKTASSQSNSACRFYKTEVMSPENQQLKTVSIKACKDNNGKWNETETSV